jgi:cell division septation protein DedD
MSEAPKTVEEPVAAAPATETPAAEAVVESTPAVTEPATETPATTTTEPATTEAAAPVKEEVKPVEEGVLGYKAPGLLKGFIFQKKFFWFGSEPVETKSWEPTKWGR